MFEKYKAWNFINKKILSTEHNKIDLIVSYLSKNHLSISELNFIKNKLYHLHSSDDSVRYLIASLNQTMKSRLKEESDLAVLNKELELYDFDRFLNKIENNDFKWYLSPKGYDPNIKLSHKVISNIFNEVNSFLGKSYVFSGNKNNYYFYELDYESKRVILIYHQLNIEKVVNDELKLMRKANPSLPNISFSKDLDDVSLGIIKDIFEESCSKLESRLDILRKELSNAPPGDEKKSIAEKITVLHASYNKRINLISQSTVLLSSYYHHFLRESNWRIIDVFSHSRGGLVYYFGKPISGFWIWTISKHGDFNLGNRQENMRGGYGVRLPHSTVAQGKSVYGAGEVEFIDGKINRFNSQSGHYFHVGNPVAYNDVCKKIFLSFSNRLGLKGKKEFTSQQLN